MASRATNDAVERLRVQQADRRKAQDRRHGAQKRALVAVDARQAAVEAAEQEREAVTARLNASVADALAGRDVAVAVLVQLSSVEDVAELVGPSVVEVRRAVQRAPKSDVVAGAEQMLTGGSAGRPRAARVSAGREVGEARPVLAGVEGGPDREQSGDAERGVGEAE